MEEPSTSIHSGDLRAESRSSRATTSGFVTTLAGVSLSVRAADQVAIDALRATFDPADLGPQDTDGRSAIEVVLDHGAREVPVGVEAIETYPDLHVWRDGELLVLGHESGVCAHVDDDTVIIGSGAADAVDLVVAYRRLLPHAFAHVLATNDRFVMHAAAVAPPGSGAFVLVGSTGAGKSTLAYGALRAGWAVLGDDLVVVSRRGADIVAEGFPKPLAIPGDALADTDLPRSDPTDLRGRVRLPVSVLARGEHRVAGVVELERERGREIDEMAVADMLAAVVGSFPGASESGRTHRFLAIAAELTRGPTARLRPPPEIRDSPAAAAASLARLTAALQ